MHTINKKSFLCLWIIASIFLLSFFTFGLNIANVEAIVVTMTPTLITSPTSTLRSNSTADFRISVLETQAVELEKKITKPPKDVWDVISAVGPLLGGVAVGLIGFYGTRVYKRRQLAVDEYKTSLIKSNTVKNFLPYLTQQKDRQRKIAILAISKVDNHMADEIDDILKSTEQAQKQPESEPVSARNPVRKRRKK